MHEYETVLPLQKNFGGTTLAVPPNISCKPGCVKAVPPAAAYLPSAFDVQRNPAEIVGL
jgi:hypothetical protein